MICLHPTTHVVVWNDIVSPPGRLTVIWCPDCGAIKREFPTTSYDWERPSRDLPLCDDEESSG